MKKMLLAIYMVFSVVIIQAQEFTALNFSVNGSVNNGIKIKTNIPYVNGTQMPTVILEGYNYGKTESIGILLNWYVHSGNFIRYTASSYGSYTPTIKLANENNKVVIFIEDQTYFLRFQVRAFAKGLPDDIEANYTGWTYADELLTGSNVVTVSYKTGNTGWLNNGNSVVYNDKNVGIGIENPNEKLVVNGKIKTQEIKVDLSGWPDFVFYDDYELPTLNEVEGYIKGKGHLKDIPSAQDVENNGVLLGEMNAKLLQKIEELTLYTIAQQKEIESLKEELNNKNNDVEVILTRLKQVEDLIKK